MRRLKLQSWKSLVTLANTQVRYESFFFPVEGKGNDSIANKSQNHFGKQKTVDTRENNST